MGWIKKHWRGCVGAVAIVMVALTAAALAWCNPARFAEVVWSQTAAGWAQAFGTIAAVVFAYWQGQRAFAMAEKQRRDNALLFLGQIAGLTVDVVALIAKANQELDAANADGFGETAVALRDKQRSFSKVTEIPVREWPSPFLAAAFDLALEHLREVTDDLQAVVAAMRAKRLTNESWAEFVERGGIFAFRADSLLQQVAFYKAVNERGPGPTVRRFENGELIVELADGPRPARALAYWARERSKQLRNPAAGPGDAPVEDSRAAP